MFKADNVNLDTNIDQERVFHIKNFTDEYLKGKIHEIVPLNVADVKVILKVFKDLYSNLEVEKTKCFKVAYDKALADFNSSRPQTKRDSRVIIKFHFSKHISLYAFLYTDIVNIF